MHTLIFSAVWGSTSVSHLTPEILLHRWNIMVAIIALSTRISPQPRVTVPLLLTASGVYVWRWVSSPVNPVSREGFQHAQAVCMCRLPVSGSVESGGLSETEMRG